MGQDVEGLQDFQRDAPNPPIPYREPEAVKPHGFWESLAAYMPEISAGPGSTGGGKLLALLANVARIPGATSMRRRGAQNERSKEFVKDLNSRQALKYNAELDDWKYDMRPSRSGGRRSMDWKYMDDKEVYIPEIDEFVPKGGAVHNRYLNERLMAHFRGGPKTPKGPKATTPKRSPGLTTAIAYWKKQILSPNFPDMVRLRERLRQEPDSIRMAPEVQEALRLRTREFGAQR